jgi:hypothetical protein
VHSSISAQLGEIGFPISKYPTLQTQELATEFPVLFEKELVGQPKHSLDPIKSLKVPTGQTAHPTPFRP